MLQLKIPLIPEGWDEEKQEFVDAKYKTIQLEHSLVSLKRWESKWHKPFLSKQDKTVEETIDYIRCMTITQNVDPKVYECITAENIEDVNSYIGDPMTATTFSNSANKKGNNEIITAEIIYYWMIALNIPEAFQKWHLNSLLTLIRVCEIKNSPPKKRSRQEIANSYAAINADRKKKLNTKG